MWTGIGFATLMLFAVSACALLPLTSHADAASSRLVPHIAFAPMRSSFRPAVQSGASTASRAGPMAMKVPPDSARDNLYGQSIGKAWGTGWDWALPKKTKSGAAAGGKKVTARKPVAASKRPSLYPSR